MTPGGDASAGATGGASVKVWVRRIALGLVAFAGLVVGVTVVLYRSVTLPGEVRVPAGTARNVAQYVEMSDGVRLAVDVWFPTDLAAGQRVPTLMRATRYWRAQDNGPLVRAQIAFTAAEPDAVAIPVVEEFNGAGYAVALVDVRGSGASFGDRPTELGRREAEDLGEVVAWIAAQPWSNGRVGTWGVSYEGNTAAMAAASAPPALVAIAPQFADFDAWAHLLWPGGVFVRGFIEEWGAAVQAMDAGDICALAGVTGGSCRVVRAATRGVKRVDGPDGERLYQEARAEHATLDVAVAAEAARFRDAVFGEVGASISDLSIQEYREGIERSGVAVFSWAGWMDAGTVDGALALQASFANPVRLVIGPWSHGGAHNTDPFLPASAPTDPSSSAQRRMLLDFFDHYVKEGATGPAEGVGEIAYYTFGEGWKTTGAWPPRGPEPTRWYFAEGGRLVREAPRAPEAADSYTVDFAHTTGIYTRWHTQLGGGDVIYGDRREADARLLTYTSAPLEHAVEITGAVEVDLYVASTEADGAFFGYLEVVDPDGTVRYVTEGQLRALHRAPCDGPPPYPVQGPCHPFTEAAARPMTPGAVERVRFGLFTTSILVAAGHRLRIALAGHDDSVFDCYPAEGEIDFWIYEWDEVDDETRAVVSVADVVWPTIARAWAAGNPPQRRAMVLQFAG